MRDGTHRRTEPKQTVAIADRAYVLENGRITLQGTGESLLNNAHVKTAYLGV